MSSQVPYRRSQFQPSFDATPSVSNPMSRWMLLVLALPMAVGHIGKAVEGAGNEILGSRHRDAAV